MQCLENLLEKCLASPIPEAIQHAALSAATGDDAEALLSELRSIGSVLDAVPPTAAEASSAGLSLAAMRAQQAHQQKACTARLRVIAEENARRAAAAEPVGKHVQGIVERLFAVVFCSSDDAGGLAKQEATIAAAHTAAGASGRGSGALRAPSPAEVAKVNTLRRDARFRAKYKAMFEADFLHPTAPKPTAAQLQAHVEAHAATHAAAQARYAQALAAHTAAQAAARAEAAANAMQVRDLKFYRYCISCESFLTMLAP